MINTLLTILFCIEFAVFGLGLLDQLKEITDLMKIENGK